MNRGRKFLCSLRSLGWQLQPLTLEMLTRGNAVFTSRPVLLVMISFVLLTAEVPICFFQRENMTSTVTKSAALSGCRLKGFRLSRSDLGVLVGFLVFVVFAFFHPLLSSSSTLSQRDAGRDLRAPLVTFSAARELSQERNLQGSIVIWRMGIGTQVLESSVLSLWLDCLQVSFSRKQWHCLHVPSSFSPITLIRGNLVPLEVRVADAPYLFSEKSKAGFLPSTFRAL